jgi:hypothetical protein
MKPEIRFTRIWSDDDLLEQRIEVCDGRSHFSIDSYVGVDWPSDVMKSLLVFRNHVHGGLFDLKTGEFGLEYASGAFLARMHFAPPGTLYVSTIQQSDHFEYKGNRVASEARLFLKTEPVLLDRFIEELDHLRISSEAIATLTCTGE